MSDLGVIFRSSVIVFYFFSLTVNEFPVLKADGIKYIMIFRNQVSSAPPHLCLFHVAASLIDCCQYRTSTSSQYWTSTSSPKKKSLVTCDSR